MQCHPPVNGATKSYQTRIGIGVQPKDSRAEVDGNEEDPRA
jgi:hypothetical protein